MLLENGPKFLVDYEKLFRDGLLDLFPFLLQDIATPHTELLPDPKILEEALHGYLSVKGPLN